VSIVSKIKNLLKGLFSNKTSKRFKVLSLQASASNTTAIEYDTSTSTAKPANGAYKPNTTICFDDLIGCFSNISPFTNALGYLPIDPDILNTEFKLYTLGKLDEPDDITYRNKYTLLSSSYDPRYPLKFIIHGFQNSAKKDKDPWVFEMAEAFIKRVKTKTTELWLKITSIIFL
jgi:hypothetical protein